jgi:hypothetical protein
MLVLVALTAFAQSRDCSPYDHAKWAADMDKADEALAAGSVDVGRPILAATHKELLCLDVVANPAYVARFGRQLALAFFFDQDDDAVRRWGLMSRYADAELAWPSSVPMPLRDAIEQLEDPISGHPEGMGLLVPKKGGLFWNGRPLADAQAPAEVPGLVQVGDAKGIIVDAYWQDGAAFPARVLVAGGGPVEAPKWWTPAVATVASAPVTPQPAPVVDQPPPPPAPVEPPPPVAATDVPPAPEPGAYVDPFEDARRRALSHSISARVETDAAGNTKVVRTEVMTFVSDPSNGHPVSNAQFADWLKDYPEWAPGGARTKSGADAGYLQAWGGGKAPPAALAAAPATWVSFTAAQAYCGSWGNQVAPAEQAVADALAWELRSSAGGPVKKPASGEAKPATATETAGDLGFRCAP